MQTLSKQTIKKQEMIKNAGYNHVSVCTCMNAN